jgi:hypothetical protein
MHVEPTVRALSGLGCTRICVLGVSARRGQQLADMSPHRQREARIGTSGFLRCLSLPPSYLNVGPARWSSSKRVHVHFAFCWK